MFINLINIIQNCMIPICLCIKGVINSKLKHFYHIVIHDTCFAYWILKIYIWIWNTAADLDRSLNEICKFNGTYIRLLRLAELRGKGWFSRFSGLETTTGAFPHNATPPMHIRTHTHPINTLHYATATRVRIFQINPTCPYIVNNGQVIIEFMTHRRTVT